MRKLNKLSGIYKISCIKNNKFYIGSSVNIKRRLKTHLKLLNQNKHDKKDMDIKKVKNMEFREFANSKINKEKLKLVKKNKFFNEEVVVLKSPRMQQYYRYLIDNVDLDKDNPNNSYVMWLVNKVDKIDTNKSTSIIVGHTSLPDIDTDLSVDFREKVIEYLINKWGEDKVSQMITFGRLQGKAALKEVFRAQPDLVKHLMKVRAEKEGKKFEDITISPFELCNEITSYIPDEATIVDELQQIRDETGNEDYGILNWAIDHIDYIKEAYKFYKPLFDQSMRLEGTKKSQSRHAAGLVISDVPISELVPLVYDASNKTRVVGFEMGSAEMCGVVKFDFLGLVCLDKMKYAQDLINEAL